MRETLFPKWTLFAILAATLAPIASAQEAVAIRLGHFPNITHAHALIASQLTRQGRPWLEPRLGGNVKIGDYVYNAGPSAMEAIFTNSLDVTYVGPNPVLNAYARSKAKEIRIISGATQGGAALVVQGDGRITKPADFRGKKLATPQLGNTQDVAARAWLKKQGYRITTLGGDVSVIPTANPDQLALFQRGEIDAVWTVEPWVTRLEREAGGKIFLEQKDDFATVLASSVRFKEKNLGLVNKLVAAHRELTDWINANPQEAQELVRAELKQLTTREFPAETAAQAWARLKFSNDVSREGFAHLVTEAQSVGFLKDMPPLDQLFASP